MPNDPTDLLTYHDSIHRVLLRFTGDEHAAEDILQETYMKALRYAEAKGPPNNPKAWLASIARNAARDYFARQPRTTSIEAYTLLLADGKRSPLESSLQQDEGNHVREVIQRLGAIDRDVLERFYEHGQGCATIALENGIRHSSAKARLCRARRHLKGLLEGDALR